jgi:hypothetical protein
VGVRFQKKNKFTKKSITFSFLSDLGEEVDVRKEVFVWSMEDLLGEEPLLLPIEL